MKLVDIVPREAIVTDLSADDRDSAIDKLLDVLEAAGKVKPDKRDDIMLALLKREAVSSTALGRGVAIPHTKTRAVSEFCGAIGIAPGGIDCSAPDGQPVTVFFLFLSPENAISGHLQLMAHIAGIARNSRYLSLLRTARNIRDVHQLLERCEEYLFGTPDDSM